MADTLTTYALGNDSPLSGTQIGISDKIFQHSNSNYDIANNLVYPSDLQDPISKKNFIVFHINVNQDSKFVEYGNTTDLPIRKSTARFGENFPSSGDKILSNVGTFAKSAVDYFGNGDEITVPTQETITEQQQKYSQIDKGIDYAKKVLKETTKPLRRLKGSIMLYMPISVGAEYGISYDTAEMGILGTLAESAKNGSTMEAATNSIGQVLTRIGANVMGRGLNEVGAFAGINSDTTGNFSAAVNAATRKTFNPKKEQLFDDVRFRTFTYQFDFSPRNQEECNTVINIINTFKFHMHPEIDKSQFFLMYPSEFDIEYHIYEEGQNPYINKILSCALESLKITYGPGSNWATLINGCPTQIHITLTFIELQPLTKNLIKDGGY
jgi:hypothetical protein